jgi:hypothetical protein
MSAFICPPLLLKLWPHRYVAQLAIATTLADNLQPPVQGIKRLGLKAYKLIGSRTGI